LNNSDARIWRTRNAKSYIGLLPLSQQVIKALLITELIEGFYESLQIMASHSVVTE
jgi:hypothetical protein